MNSRKTSIARQLPRTALAMALGLGLTGVAFGQATTGSIFGQVPAGNGETVTVRSTSGVTRQVAVDPSGRYDIGSLPLGSYTVTLQRDGKDVDSRSNVT
ncbi:MAG TPA: carboxypeptidase-like regulatory domain-containing protein, partial [Rhodanobacter sp.]|nr:carboxypeptidase-like regulatory domain-containing protein [Rhodanobacter sp.]